MPRRPEFARPHALSSGVWGRVLAGEQKASRLLFSIEYPSATTTQKRDGHPMSNFTAIVIPVEGKPFEAKITDYTQIQQIVGGPFDVVRFELGPNELSMYVHDEGLLLDLEVNRTASLLTGRHLVGIALLAGAVSPDGEQLSLDKRTMTDYLSTWFNQLEEV